MKKCCFCNGKTMTMIAKGDSYSYYRCPACHWYSTELNSGKQEENLDYDSYMTFDGEGDLKFDDFVSMAQYILQYKFGLLGGGAKIFSGCRLFRRTIHSSV